MSSDARRGTRDRVRARTVYMAKRRAARVRAATRATSLEARPATRASRLEPSGRSPYPPRARSSLACAMPSNHLRVPKSKKLARAPCADISPMTSSLDASRRSTRPPGCHRRGRGRPRSVSSRPPDRSIVRKGKLGQEIDCRPITDARARARPQSFDTQTRTLRSSPSSFARPRRPKRFGSRASSTLVGAARASAHTRVVRRAVAEHRVAGYAPRAPHLFTW